MISVPTWVIAAERIEWADKFLSTKVQVGATDVALVLKKILLIP
ncbi:MAG: Uncharacterised protein [Polaribacter sejongensis]|nr:MAG: Uncharacterised protein [Polaribacter sejongensis]